jgi:hypothetical protein
MKFEFLKLGGLRVTIPGRKAKSRDMQIDIRRRVLVALPDRTMIRRPTKFTDVKDTRDPWLKDIELTLILTINQRTFIVRFLKPVIQSSYQHWSAEPVGIDAAWTERGNELTRSYLFVSHVIKDYQEC